MFRLSHFCGTIAEPTTSVTNEVQIRFFAQGALLKHNNKPPKLEVLYTAFREVNDPSKYTTTKGGESDRLFFLWETS